VLASIAALSFPINHLVRDEIAAGIKRRTMLLGAHDPIEQKDLEPVVGGENARIQATFGQFAESEVGILTQGPRGVHKVVTTSALNMMLSATGTVGLMLLFASAPESSLISKFSTMVMTLAPLGCFFHIVWCALKIQAVLRDAPTMMRAAFDHRPVAEFPFSVTSGTRESLIRWLRRARR